RIVHFARRGGPSIFQLSEREAGGAGEAGFKARGGHRLWLAPEAVPFTYFPDNRPVAREGVAAGAVRPTPPPEGAAGLPEGARGRRRGRGRVQGPRRPPAVAGARGRALHLLPRQPPRGLRGRRRGRRAADAAPGGGDGLSERDRRAARSGGAAGLARAPHREP